MSALPQSRAVPAVPTYIVQAGGQGTRMEHYTWNKPKCLVPIDGKPLLYHLMSCAPDAHFIVIGDYLYDVLKAYVEAFPPPARVTLVRAEGKGTCAGMANAVAEVEDPSCPLGIVWSDLLFEHLPDIKHIGRPLIGLSGNFPCRWSEDPNRGFVEEISFDRGICGFFIFPNVSFLRHVPGEGEFVRWLKDALPEYETHTMSGVSEVGNSAVALRHWEKRGYARFFNDVTMLEDRVVKRARVPALAQKIEDETLWYEEALKRGFTNIPRLLARSPLTLSRIDGHSPYELNLKPRQKYAILEAVFAALDTLHGLGSAPADPHDCFDMYVDKTVKRVAKILSLVPKNDTPAFTINGRRCRNPFDGESDPQAAFGDIACEGFRFVHGDPHFSNMLVNAANEVFLIDPRGVFGKTRFFGDPDYDWAKLYFSAVGDRDAFDRRRFRLVVWDTTVSLDIDSAGYSFTKQMFEERLGPQRMRKIALLHALIWLAYAGWVDDDVDSMIAAFFNGLYWLEEWAQG